MFLLYDGGRVIFPLPPDLDAKKLWSEFFDGLGFQQLFHVRMETGDIPVLCAVKAIPN